MKNIFVIILLTFAPIFASSQTSDVVKNITWKFTNLKMEITYDLLSPDDKNRTYDITLKINLEDQIITPVNGVVGINQQASGNDKKIEWYFTRAGYSEEELNTSGLQVIIQANNPNPPIEAKTEPPTVVDVPQKPTTSPPISRPKKIKPPSLILPAATTGVGLSVLAIGLVTEGKAKDLYKIYETHTVESAQREADYQAANDKHKSAQFLQIGGGVLVGTGAYLLYRTIQKRKDSKFSVVPTLDNAPLYGNYGGIGVIITVNGER